MQNRDRPFLRSERGEPMPIGMAMDEMPRAALRRAAARDQDPDDNGNSQEAYKKLFEFLAERMSEDDVQTAAQLVGQIFDATSDTDDGNGNTMNTNPALAGDRRPTRGYSKHFPDAHRLGRQGLTGVVSASGNTGSMAADRAASSSYAKRFPDAHRLGWSR